MPGGLQGTYDLVKGIGIEEIQLVGAPELLGSCTTFLNHDFNGFFMSAEGSKEMLRQT